MKKSFALHEIVESLTVGAVFLDVDHTPTYCNDIFAGHLNHEGSIDLVQLCRSMAEAGSPGKLQRKDIELSGSPDLYLQVTARQLEYYGEFAGTLVIAQDITEIAKLNRVRSDFVANLSHELRTPVGAISVLAEAMSDTTDESDLLRLSKRIQSESIRLGSMIEDLLNLSWLESNQYQNFEYIDLADLMSEVEQRTAERSSAAKVEVEFDLSPGIQLSGERTQLVSALVNLVDNAVKHSLSNSTILVKVAAQGSRWLDISVSNYGEDIPVAEQSRIFERFYRLETDRSRKTGGTGLGLAICRHVVVNHGGEIAVESGAGLTKFTITLPLNRAPVINRDRKVKAK